HRRDRGGNWRFLWLHGHQWHRSISERERLLLSYGGSPARSPIAEAIYTIAITARGRGFYYCGHAVTGGAVTADGRGAGPQTFPGSHQHPAESRSRRTGRAASSA